jgi:shikimate dehydrogenase
MAEPSPPRTRLRVGVIGDPVAHSLSPAMQQPALDALGIAAIYELWPTTAAELPGRIAGLRAPDVLGANVTVPHKRGVMSLLDEVRPLARRAGAVNTILRRDDRLIGENTDIAGFATALGAVCRDAGDRRALILGAGGAARAVVLALESLGMSRIAVANRTTSRLDRLIADLAPTPVARVAYDDTALRQALSDATLLINATAAGWQPGESPLPLDLLGALPVDALVVDLTYRETDLLAAARHLRLTTLDGLPMLVHQGAGSLELWTGHKAPVDLMLAAAGAARDARAATH